MIAALFYQTNSHLRQELNGSQEQRKHRKTKSNDPHSETKHFDPNNLHCLHLYFVTRWVHQNGEKNS